MKRTYSFALLLLGSALLFIGCKDQNSSLLSEAQPSLAAADHMVKLTTKTGDGPEVIEYVTPVPWDGSSKLKDGVVYQFNNSEELVTAFSASDPGFAAKYQEYKQSSAKTKANSAANLAGAYGYADVSVSGSTMYGEAAGACDDGYASVSFTLIVDVASPSVGYMNTFTDGDGHYVSIDNEGPCPYSGLAHAWVYGPGVPYVGEHDYGECE